MADTLTAPPTLHLFVLSCFDEETGAATELAGVIGIEEGTDAPRSYLRLCPDPEGRDGGWRTRLSLAPLTAELLSLYLVDANGITWDIEEVVEVPAVGSLEAAVEAVYDEELAGYSEFEER